MYWWNSELNIHRDRLFYLRILLEMYVKTEKATIRQRLKEIELLKKENKELRESNETQYELIKKLLKENEKLKLLAK